MIVALEYRGAVAGYFGERGLQYFWRVEYWLVSRVIEVLSAVEARIDRPDSGSNHCHACAHPGQHDGDKRIPRAGQ